MQLFEDFAGGWTRAKCPKHQENRETRKKGQHDNEVLSLRAQEE